MGSWSKELRRRDDRPSGGMTTQSMPCHRVSLDDGAPSMHSTRAPVDPEGVFPALMAYVGARRLEGGTMRGTLKAFDLFLFGKKASGSGCPMQEERAKTFAPHPTLDL